MRSTSLLLTSPSCAVILAGSTCSCPSAKTLSCRLWKMLLRVSSQNHGTVRPLRILNQKGEKLSWPAHHLLNSHTRTAMLANHSHLIRQSRPSPCSIPSPKPNLFVNCLHDAQGRLGRLVAALKQQRRQSRAVQAAMQSLRRLKLDSVTGSQ